MILKSGCFELRKWKSNSPEILEGIRASISDSQILHFTAPEVSKILAMVLPMMIAFPTKFHFRIVTKS